MLNNKYIHKALFQLKLLVLVVLLPFISFSQDDPTMLFDGVIKDGKGKPLSGVTIKVLQDGSEIYSATTNSKGKFEPYTADYGYKYKVIIVKDNFVKNTIEINAKDGYHEDDVADNVGVVLDYKLIEKIEGIDYKSLENKPRDKFKFDVVDANVHVDKAYETKRNNEIDAFFKKIADKEKEKLKNFKALVKAGDAAFSKKDWENAIKNWEDAFEIKDEEALGEKIADAQFKYDEELEEKELLAKMNKFIKEGDESVKLLKFENAREKYEIAASVYSKSKIPQQKLKELDKLILEAGQNQNQKKFDELMSLASIKIKSESYDAAKKLLAEAQLILPKDKFPKVKLKEIENILKKKAANKSKYDKLIAEASSLLVSKSYEKSKAKYQSASELLPEESLPKEKIIEIDNLLKKLKEEEKAAKEKRDKFNALVKKAESLFKSEKLEESKTEYANALKLFPEEEKPKSQIIEIDKLLAAKKLEEEEKAKKEKEYQALIASADKLVNEKKYLQSIAEYTDALKIKKAEKYPANQIKKVEGLIKAEEELAKKAEKEKAEKEKLEAKYNSLIADANKLFEKESYQESIEIYLKALEIKKAEKIPTEQIAKAKEFIKIAKDKAKAEAEKIAAANKLETEYKELREKGDKSYKSNNYSASTSFYEQALVKKPGDSYSISQIEKIKDILTAEKEKADKLAADLLAEKKRKEQEAADKKAAADKLEKAYQALIAKADKSRDSKKYTESIGIYEEALVIKPKDSYSLTQIDKIKEIIKAEKAKAAELLSESERLKQEAADKKAAADKLEKEYLALIVKADENYKGNNYAKSTGFYQDALVKKPGDSYSISQIEKIKDILTAEKEKADRIAADLLAEEKRKLAAAANKKDAAKKLEAEYNALILEANDFFGNKKYLESIEVYKKALLLKEKETFPAIQIAKATGLLEDAKALAEKNKKDLENAEEKLNADYKKYIAQGDKDFVAKNYPASINSYKEALKLRSKRYPKEQIEKINDLIEAEKQNELDLAAKLEKEKRDKERELKEKEERERLAALDQKNKDEKAKIEKKYQDAIKLGDKFLKENKYESSKNKYMEALTFKNEKYPKNQLSKIAKILETLANANALKIGYKDAIARADVAFGAQDYKKAKGLYEKATRLNPTPSYPKNKINEIDEILSELEENAQNEKDRIAKLNEDYKKLIAKGDENFDNEKYRKAKFAYQKAYNLKQKSYPKNRIKEIEEILNLLASNKTTISADDYFNIDADLYGEEVDMSSSDGSILISNIEDNSAWRNYMKLKEYIDSASIASGKKNILNGKNIQLTYQEYETLIEAIQKKTGNNSMGRNGSIVSLALFDDAWTEFNAERNTKEGGVNLSISSFYDKLADAYSEQIAITKMKKGLGDDYEKYIDKKTEIDKLLASKEGKTNVSVYDYIEYFKQKKTEEFSVKSLNAKKNNIDYENYKDLVVENNLKLTEKEKTSRDNETDFLEKIEDNSFEKQKKGGERIMKFNEDYIEYEESSSNIMKELSENSNSGNETTNQELEGFKDKKVEESKKYSAKDNEKIEEYDKLNDKLAEQNKIISDKEKLSRKSEEDYLEKTGDLISEKSKKSQEKIGSNNNEYENFKATKAKSNIEIGKKNTKKSLETSDAMNKIAEDKTQKSDATINQLAAIFPEGVTQKVYEKKNDFGEVISVTIRRVVVKNNKGNDYVHRKTKAGNYYFKNGKSISEGTWDIETSGEIVN